MASPLYIPFLRQTFKHSAIATGIDSLTRIELIVCGSECLQHMLGLARKYSDIGDRDRCMILRSSVLLSIAGLLELYRSVLKEGVVATKGELLESRQKCKELLVLLANTSLQTLKEDGQRIGNFITVSSSRRSSQHLIDCDLSTITTGIWRGMILKQSFALSQPVVSGPPSYHFPHRRLE